MGSNINIRFAEVPRFTPGDPAALEFLDQQGYVVFAEALSARQAHTALHKIWDYLEQLGTGINRDDPTTWDNDRWPTAVHGGILPSHGIGHSDAQWYIRDVGQVQQCFAQVWGTDELLVSFDGVSVWRPWGQQDHWRTNDGNSWLHIDQHPIGRPGKHCIQGLVNLLESSPETGGNVVVPGSHQLFDHIPDLYKDRLARIHPSIDHFRFPHDDPGLQGYEPIMAHLYPGDLLLWDSRTIHCSAPATTSPKTDGVLRAASLVCMMPREKSNAAVIEQRKAAVNTLTSTTNWSDRFINADQFPQIMAVADRDKFIWPQPPELNLNQLKMVGWTEDELAASPLQ